MNSNCYLSYFIRETYFNKNQVTSRSRSRMIDIQNRWRISIDLGFYGRIEDWFLVKVYRRNVKMECFSYWLHILELIEIDYISKQKNFIDTQFSISLNFSKTG